MGATVQITFHQLDHSDSVAFRIHQKAEQLQKIYSRITAIRVVVEPSFQRHRQGNLYRVHVSLMLPRGKVIVGKHSVNESHADIYIAIRDSFRAARRQLEDYVCMHFRKKDKERQAKQQSPPIHKTSQ